MKKSLAAFITFLVIGCSSGTTDEFTQEDKDQVEVFVDKLTASIQNREYDGLRSAWSHRAFKSRVAKLLHSDPTVFYYYYDKELKDEVDLANFALVNKQKYNNGEIYHLKTEHFKDHSEATFLLIYEGAFEFRKYRVELINNKPFLTDYFVFPQNIWQSLKVTDIVRINKLYLAGSNERVQASRSFTKYQEAMQQGDDLAALEYLYEVPETHQHGTSISMLRINCAARISDSLLIEVIELEKMTHESYYLNYLYSYFTNDSLGLDASFDYIQKEFEIGDEELEIISNSNLVWN